MLIEQKNTNNAAPVGHTPTQGGLKMVILFGLLACFAVAGQVAMAGLPNIEPVSLLFILYTVTFGPSAIIIVAVFVLLQGLIYGFGMWWLNYLYIWPLLVLLALPFKKMKSPLGWALFSAFFGLCFGAFCAIPYFLMGGASLAFSYWASGILFDIAHMAGNFVLCLLLFSPLQKALAALVGKTFATG